MSNVKSLLIIYIHEQKVWTKNYKGYDQRVEQNFSQHNINSYLLTYPA